MAFPAYAVRLHLAKEAKRTLPWLMRLGSIGLSTGIGDLQGRMQTTAYHAKLYAHELTKRSASDNVEKLATALSEAQVDLNPHQIEAALFAFRSPFSKGAILADEVGLGKTIEAGILLAQRWAERHRRLLVICPANLRKQWSQELTDKFYLPTSILETRTFNEAIKAGNLNPFEVGSGGSAKIAICSFQFARTKEPYLRQTPWDMVVIDEAHRLRNVYKTGNKIAKAIRDALLERQKVLLTATPLQNSLLELYGLVSIIDEFTFGDLRSFKAQFSKLNSAEPSPEAVRSRAKEQFDGPVATAEVHEAMMKLASRAEKANSEEFAELKQRLRPICQRTLRKQVLQYVNYTQRHALVQEFTPGPEEQRLYDLVSKYLQQETLYALPSSQRQLMTLMLRKLLASSTYAISNTLAGLAGKLEMAEAQSAALDAAKIDPDFAENFELLPELEEEWAEDDEDSEEPTPGTQKAAALSEQQREERRQERAKLLEFHALAQSIQRNSKGDRLLTALDRGFARAKEAGNFQQKAIIFTESRRTQEYLFQLLEQTEFAGKLVLFNGTNTDPGSQRIYREWLERNQGTDRISGSATADKRAALVEYFRDEASIMIATEAAAEGINLQFCNLVVNYDLPWNPQRIEQRIGRCHRYGQKFDVVVVNFLNKENAADVRVYELLAEKFKLFDGVFGASDEVLGAIESGIDFEKRIVAIYQQCRTAEQIVFEFDQLQQELAVEIGAANAHAQDQLLSNFDQDVIDKVRMSTASTLDRFQRLLWGVSTFCLSSVADFAPDGYSFNLRANPYPYLTEDVYFGQYQMRKDAKDANIWRIGHPLAQAMLVEACSLDTPVAEITFETKPNVNPFGVMGELRGCSGWLTCVKLTLTASLQQDHLLFAGFVHEKVATNYVSPERELDAEACRLLFDQPKAWVTTVQPGQNGVDRSDWLRRSYESDVSQTEMLLLSEGQAARMESALKQRQASILEEVNRTDTSWLDAESVKLDRWAEDRKFSLEYELKELDEAIRDARRQSLAAALLPEKLAMQQKLRGLEADRAKKRRELFESQDKVEAQRDSLIADMQKRLVQQSSMKPLFTIRWRIV
jgi:SNF2 family DNA or RNA helicase